MGIRAGFESVATPALALTLQATHDEWVVLQCLGPFEQIVQLRIIVVGRALKPRPHEDLLRLVERPEIAFELQHRLLPFADHLHTLASARGALQAPPEKAWPRIVSLVRMIDPDPSSERSKRPYLIGVAGGSNSGKTTIAERLAELIGEQHLSLIRLDSYYIERSDEPMEQRITANYDHPDAFDWSLLNDHLAALTAGASVDVPVYDYAIHDRSDRCVTVRPSKVVVVEGILVLWEPRLRERFDLKIFVDTPADLRIIRRLKRDVAERGRTPDSILDQYLATVRPSHELFIEPSKRYADVIVPEGGLNRPALEVLLARVRELASG